MTSVMISSFQLSPSVLLSREGGGVVLLHRDTHDLYYFNLAAEGFLQLLKAPLTLKEFLSSISFPKSEIAEVKRFWSLLRSEGILMRSPGTETVPVANVLAYSRPRLLRKLKNAMLPSGPRWDLTGPDSTFT